MNGSVNTIINNRKIDIGNVLLEVEKIEDNNQVTEKVGRAVYMPFFGEVDLIDSWIKPQSDFLKVEKWLKYYFTLSKDIGEGLYASTKCITQFFSKFEAFDTVDKVLDGINQAFASYNFLINSAKMVASVGAKIISDKKFKTFDQQFKADYVQNIDAEIDRYTRILSDCQKGNEEFPSVQYDKKIKETEEILKHLSATKELHKRHAVRHKADNTVTNEGFRDIGFDYILKLIKNVCAVVRLPFKFISGLPWFVKLIILPVAMVADVVSIGLAINDLKTSIDTLKLQNKISKLTEEQLKTPNISDSEKIFLIALRAKNRLERNFTILSISKHVASLTFVITAAGIGVASTILGVLLAAGVIVFPPLTSILLGVGVGMILLGAVMGMAYLALDYGFIAYYKPNEFKEIIFNQIYSRMVFNKAITRLVVGEKKKLYKNRNKELLNIFQSIGFKDIKANLNKEERLIIGTDTNLDVLDTSITSSLTENSTVNENHKKTTGYSYRLYDLYDIIAKDYGGVVVGLDIKEIWTGSTHFIEGLNYATHLMQAEEAYMKKYNPKSITIETEVEDGEWIDISIQSDEHKREVKIDREKNSGVKEVKSDLNIIDIKSTEEWKKNEEKWNTVEVKKKKKVV